MNTAQLSKFASPHQDAIGWYSNAKEEIAELCGYEGWNTDRFTAVLSILSPRCSVRRNIRNTLSYIGTSRLFGDTMKTIRGSLASYETTGDVGGKRSGFKIRAFYHALMGNTESIVLDVHMANLFRIPQAKFHNSPNERRKCETKIKDVAKKLKVYPCDCQAMLWYGQKRNIGENPTKFPILEEYYNWLAWNKDFPLSGHIENRAFNFEV